MAFARDAYTAGSSQTDFTITFPYLEEDHVVVSVDGVEQGQGADDDYTFADATTIRFNSGLSSGDVVVLQRKTSQDARLTDYTAGALTEADLDNDSFQAFYMAQEAVDIANLSMRLDTDEQWTAQSKRIKDVTDPSTAQDAATKAYVDALAVSTGNVPTPENPADDGKVIAASGGSFAWTDFVVSMISDAAAFMQTFLGSNTEVLARSNLGVGGLADASTWTAGQRGEVTALTDAASILIDLSDSNNFSVTLGGNRTLANPTNPVAGQSGVITVTQDGTGSRALSYGANYVFAAGTAPTLTTDANTVDLLFYYVISATKIFISHARDVKVPA